MIGGGSSMTRTNDITGLLKFLVCFILVGGLVMQICMLAAIHGTTKQTSRINAQLVDLNAERDNCYLKLANFKERGNIENLAVGLGMQHPTDDQLRVISIPSEYQNASTHTAEIADAQ